MNCLIFFMEAKSSSELIQGKLLLIVRNRYTAEYWATSGVPGWQDKHEQDDRGKGLIPSTFDLKSLEYSVITKPIPMPQKRGIMGNFYKINPHMVSINGTQRGDFGIHKDVRGNNTSLSAGNDGTAGCIGILTEHGWKDFEERMFTLEKSGTISLPLWVVYS